MPRIMGVATGQAGSVPKIRRRKYATGQVFLNGAVLTANAAGELIEVGADPNAITGVALQKAGSGPGYNLADSGDIAVSTGLTQEVSYAEANKDTEFSAVLVGAANVEVTPLVTHIDEQYGIIKRADGSYAVDTTEVTVKSVQIVDIAPDLGNVVIFKFLPTVIGGL